MHPQKRFELENPLVPVEQQYQEDGACPRRLMMTRKGFPTQIRFGVCYYLPERLTRVSGLEFPCLSDVPVV